MNRLQALAAAIPLLASTVGQAQTPQYFIATIPVPKDASSIVNIVALDATGNAIGNVLKGKQTVPEVWTGSTQITLPPIGTGVYADGKDYNVRAANALGGAAGYGVDSFGNSAGVFWDPAHKPWELVGNNDIEGISDSNVVVGAAGPSAMMLQVPYGNVTALPVMPSDARCIPYPEYCWSVATTISPNGRYIGGYTGSTFNNHFRPTNIWVDGKDTGYLTSSPGDFVGAFNNSGVAVGGYYTGGYTPPCYYTEYGPLHAFGSAKGTFTDLGGLASANCLTYANSVNASGVIVGASSTGLYDTHAVMWTNGVVSDLQTVLAAVLPANTTVTAAVHITDNGQILLWGWNSKAGTSSYLVATPAIQTRITVGSNINPSSYGQQIHLVASVIPSSGAKPLGQVTWYDNGKVLGIARLTTIGTASWEPSTWAPGVHNVTVNFAGYSPDGASTSPVFRQTVHATSTKTALASSVNPATHGKSFTLAATVIPAFGTIAGAVTFKSGSTTLGTVTIDGSTKRAYLRTTLKTAGKYSITATYGATTNFTGSTSPALVLTVR